MDTNAANNDQQALNTVARGGAALVDWELYSTRITPVALRLTLQAHGYDPSVVPDIDEEQRIRSEGARWTQGRGNADRYRCEVTEDDDCIFVQLLRRGNAGTLGSQGKAARREFTQQGALVWDKKLHAWAPDQLQPTASQEVQQALQACRAACDDARLHHDHEFIRPVLIQAPLRALGAVPFIRRNGGAMVVPMQQWDELKRLQGLVGAIGDSYLGVVRADVTDQGTVQAMQRSVRDSLTCDIAAVKQDIADWRERGSRISTAAVGERLCRYKEIRDRAQLYADALQMAVADLMADVEAAQQDARALLAQAMGEAAPVAPPVAPVPPTTGASA